MVKKAARVEKTVITTQPHMKYNATITPNSKTVDREKYMSAAIVKTIP